MRRISQGLTKTDHVEIGSSNFELRVDGKSTVKVNGWNNCEIEKHFSPFQNNLLKLFAIMRYSE